MDEKNNNLTIKKTASTEKQSRHSTDFIRTTKKAHPIGKDFFKNDFDSTKVMNDEFSNCIFELSG